MSRITSIGFLSILLVSLFMTSCETEIDIIAPKRDMTVIYGLLEANKSRHFIRINKAFVGAQSASDLAQEPGVNEYTDNELTAVVRELDGNDTSVVLTEWQLLDTITNSKQEGTFFSGQNKLYYFDAILNPNNMYQIVCFINIEGEEPKRVTAVTNLIGQRAAGNQLVQVNLERPNLTGGSEDRAEVEFIAQGEYRNEYEVTWSGAQGGASYTSFYRFYYTEVDKQTGARQRDSISFPIGTKRLDPNSLGSVDFNINPEEFYITIDRRLNDIDTQTVDYFRYASDTLQFFLEIADNTLATYIEVNQPATEVVQEQPEFTNVVNGIGIFASRLIVSTRSQSPQFSGRILRKATLEELLYSNAVDPENTYSTINKGFRLESGRCNPSILTCR